MESALRASAVEETRVPEPARVGDEGAAAAAMEQAAPVSVVSLVELPQSSGEYGDSEEVLGAGTSGGPGHGAIIQSGIPLGFLRSEKEEEAVWKAQFEVGGQIQGHLDRALELHRTTDLQISQVGASLLGIVCVWS